MKSLLTLGAIEPIPGAVITIMIILALLYCFVIGPFMDKRAPRYREEAKLMLWHRKVGIIQLLGTRN